MQYSKMRNMPHVNISLHRYMAGGLLKSHSQDEVCASILSVYKSFLEFYCFLCNMTMPQTRTIFQAQRQQKRGRPWTRENDPTI